MQYLEGGSIFLRTVGIPLTAGPKFSATSVENGRKGFVIDVLLE